MPQAVKLINNIMFGNKYIQQINLYTVEKASTRETIPCSICGLSVI